MRVLAMLHLYLPHHCAGAELTAHALLRHLAARGHDVDVLLSQSHRQIAAPYSVDDVRVHPRKDKRDPVEWMDDPATRPDVIVTHLENTTRAAILGGLRRIPVVHLLHNGHDATLRQLERSPALAVVNSDWIRAEVESWWRDHQGDRPAPPMIRVHPPVRRVDYLTTPGRHATLVNVSAAKGSETFYALAGRLPAVQFLAVGGAYGAQDRRDLPNVRWLDHMPHDQMRDQVYRRTRVLLMPSEYESYGRVGVEGACSGIPTIAHPTPGLRESLGGAGIFVDRGDVDGWALHLRRLMSPKGGWTAASQRATRRACELADPTELDQWATAVEEMASATARQR